MSRNTALAAIRLLAREANARGLLDDSTMASLERIKGQHVKGQRLGRWLTREESQLLIDEAGRGAGESIEKTRNQAIVATMLGCGLRRTEVVTLTWANWQVRASRAVWVDINGKGDKVRSVPCSSWAARYIERWRTMQQAQADNLLARVFPMSGQNAYLIALAAGEAAGLGKLTPHDLRRTFARNSYEAGAPLDQIQQVLGHASLQTTMKYVGCRLEVRAGKAAGDYFTLDDQKEELDQE